jgi:hypothetical protein
MTMDISPHRVGDDPSKPTMLECIRAGVQEFNRLHGIETKSARRGGMNPPRHDDETGRLAHLATRLMQVHASFAAKGLRGVRDEDDNSVALGLALRCAELMRERQP